MNLSDKKTAVLTDSKNFTALASSDEGLHYTVVQDGGTFEYLLDTSGGKQDKLLCPSGNCAAVCNGYLYYVSDKSLYRSKLYENGKENLGISCDYITIENGYVFCTSYGESGANNNSTKKHKLSALKAAD